MKIIAIGNSPSSGSTLLGDLLDSVPNCLCGPEFHLFSVRSFFSEFALFQDDSATSSPIASIYSKRMRLNRDELHAYGLNPKLLSELAKEADGFPDFCNRFFLRYAALRGKEPRFCFEKTPQNVQCALPFLDAFPDSFFVHVVRNPLYVARSLSKRDLFTPYLARATWLVDVAAAYAARNHPRFLTIRYEDLVDNPSATVNALLRKLGHEEADDLDVEELYANNQYRRFFSHRIASWGSPVVGKVRNGNSGEISDEVARGITWSLNSRINPAYAKLFDLPEITFVEAASHFGYLDSLEAWQNGALPDSDGAQLRLTERWLTDVAKGGAGPFDRDAYLRPVLSEPAKKS